MPKPTLSSYIRGNLDKIEKKNPGEPAFNLMLDNSVFNIDQLAEQIVFGMEQKKLIESG